MDFKKIISISGMPGLYQMVKAQKDGALVRMLGEQRIQLVSNRYNFSLLNVISVYTQSADSVGLPDVFSSMEQAEADGTPAPSSKVADDELIAYFTRVLPDYDRQRVYKSDIRKIIKWYKLLRTHNALPKPESNPEPEPNSESNPENS